MVIVPAASAADMDVGDTVEGSDYEQLPIWAVLEHLEGDGVLIRAPNGIFDSVTGKVSGLHSWFDPRRVAYLPPN